MTFEDYQKKINATVMEFAKTEPEGRLIILPLINSLSLMAANLIHCNGMDATEMADQINNEIDTHITGHLIAYKRMGK